MKNLIYALINLTLFLVFFNLSIPVWFLFLIFFIFYVYKIFRPSSAKEKEFTDVPKVVEYEKFGYWNDDDQSNEEQFGVYIQLLGKSVFIDIREDDLLEDRKKFAKRLIEQKFLLESNLKKFIELNREFSGCDVNSIGLHSENLNQGEVFWNPEGYTLLKDLQFLKE